jgi:hypothetical protein
MRSAVPTKVDEAFKAFKYVPYSALTHTARLKAARGEEDFLVNATGGLTAKGLDRKEEKSVSMVEWLGAARAAEERILVHHGESRAFMLRAHHHIVSDLARTHGWTVAVEYDIRQRELAAMHPEHDLSSLDDKCLTLISTSMILVQHNVGPSLGSSNVKRPRTESTWASQGSSPRKRTSPMCFRCGFAGHLPADCKAETTSAGQPVAPIATDSKNKHALMGPNNRVFCFRWTKDSACNFEDRCRGLHACSLCTNTNHGAGQCKARA